MRNTLITGLISLSSLLLPLPAHASDCMMNAAGNRMCIHRVQGSKHNPNINIVHFSMNGGDMIVGAVNCGNNTAYNPVTRSWDRFVPTSAFHRVCTEWE